MIPRVGERVSNLILMPTIGLYTIHNCYADKYFEYLEYVDNHIQTSSIVEFGTAMASRRRTKRNRRNKL